VPIRLHRSTDNLLENRVIEQARNASSEHCPVSPSFSQRHVSGAWPSHPNSRRSHNLCFRTLSDAAIEKYLDIDTPYDTAGSAKAESLGIALMQSMESTDPTSIIGLPLIALTHLLAEFGLDPLEHAVQAISTSSVSSPHAARP